MPSIQYSPEQVEFFSIADRHGIFFNQANAGSGKTECSSELFVRIYMKEEEKMFPHVREKRLKGISLHVTGDDQRRILKQFIVITFTVKAADELNTRILAKFVDAGIPVPTTSYGNKIKICRTIDSLMQSWFRNPVFFRAWMDYEFEAKAIDKKEERYVPRLSTSHYFLMKEMKAIHGEDIVRDGYDFFHKWPTLIVGPALESIVASIIRKQFKVKDLSDIEDPDNWKEGIAENLADVNLGDRYFDVPFFKELIEATNKRSKFEIEAKTRIEKVTQGIGNSDDVRWADKYQPLVELWEKVEMARGEFLMIYGIAKTRHYHPIHAPDNLNNKEILEAIAQSQVVNSLMLFHSLASKFARAKLHLGVMDYSDYMDTFLTTVKERKEILDLRSEYPKYGIRAKNVIVDETQDNAPCQYDVMRAMIPVKGVPYRSISVGDAKQSIYAFRGASPNHFIAAVQKYKRVKPDNVFSLSCSFRSCTSIVDLGNEIITTLPSYKDTVIKSSTIYDESGEIEISPPLKNQDDETRFVLEEIERIRKNDSGASVMILVRQSLYIHPLYRIIRDMKNSLVSMLTMHRSKGLEADYVFVLGMTSGEFPDVRGNWDQETNLFYVSATRARRKVFFTVPIYSTVIMDDGRSETREAGPSPYFRLVPSLEKAALAKGWDVGMLTEGHLFHEKERERFQNTMATKMKALREVADLKFPEPDYQELEELSLDEPTEAPAPGTLSFMRRRRKSPPKGTLQSDGTIGSGSDKKLGLWDESGDQKLRAKLISSFGKNMQVPKLKGDELSRAITLGWVKHDGSGKHLFTPGFRDILKSSRKAV
jgi:hypothetical protein